MSTTDQQFETLLDAARRAEGPSEADRNAVRKSLTGALAASTLTTGVSGAAKAAVLVGKGSALANVVLPLVAGAALGAVVMASAFVVSGEGNVGTEGSTKAVVTTAATRSSADLPRAATATSTAGPTIESPEPIIEPKASPSPSISKGESARAIDPLELESRGIAEVQRALRDGQARRALGLLDAEDRAHPRGVLVEERAAARVFALCSLGRDGEARRAAAEFARRFPNSLLGERVRASCTAP
jgi:hypothetical protein